MPAKDARHRFTAVIARPPGTGTWCYVEVPARISAALGTKGRVPVSGTVSGAALRGSMMPDGEGGHFIVVSTPVREAAGVTVGDRVRVDIAVDTAPRRVTIPPELERALRKSPAARAALRALAYSHQKRYTEWIGGAKQSATREERARKAVGMLERGERAR